MLFLPRHERSRRHGGASRKWLLSRIGEQPIPAHDGNCRPAGSGHAGLAAARARAPHRRGRNRRRRLACGAAASFRTATILDQDEYNRPESFRVERFRRDSMNEGGFSRRAMVLKIGIAVNGPVAAALAVPIVRYILSPITRWQVHL